MSKIALCGSAGSVHLAPFEDKRYQAMLEGLKFQRHNKWKDETWDIWACSPGAAFALRRCTRFFELHRWEPGQLWFPQVYCDFLKTFDGPVYVGCPEEGMIPLEDIPNQVLYPIERVETEFSSYFLTSSLSLMFALAILEIEEERKDPDHDWDEDVVAFFGVDMAATEEWATQRPGCQFFILEALRRGIGVYVPPESCLLRPEPVYGLSEWYYNYIKLTQRSRELNAKLKEAQQKKQEAEMTFASCAGALEDLSYMVKTWTSPYGLEAGKVLRLKREAQYARCED